MVLFNKQRITMTLKEKFKEKAFCMCEDMTQIDNYVDIADEFAIGFAEWFDKLEERRPYLGVYEFQKQLGSKTFKELLEIYKKEKEL